MVFLFMKSIYQSEYNRQQFTLYRHRNEWVQFYYMSVTVKVQLGDKLFKLTQGITSIDQIDQEMKRRYPNKLPSLEYFFDGAIVQDLKQLLISQENRGKTSMKIVARPSADMSRDNELSIISIISSQRQKEPSVIKAENKPIELPSIEYHMPKQFYTCYNCQGVGVYEDSQTKHLCEICKGRGQLNNDHKYLSHVKKLFQKYIKQIPKIQEVKKQEFQKIFRGLNKIYEMNITQVNKIEKMEIGKQFTYQFQVNNLGKDLPESLEVVNCQTKEFQKVKTLKSGEKMFLELGPFKCETEGLLEQAFYLCFRTENGWERLGYRFGFRTRGFKISEVKKTESNTRDLIRNLKLLSGSKKSEQYLQMKLKSMDIDLNNIQVDDQILIQIIQFIQ